MNSPHDQIQALSVENGILRAQIEQLRDLNVASVQQIDTAAAECQRLAQEVADGRFENEKLRKLNEANTQQIHAVTTECQRLSRAYEAAQDEMTKALERVNIFRREIEEGKAELDKERKAHKDERAASGCFAVIAGILIALAFIVAWEIRSHRIDDLKKQLRNARAGSGFIIIR